MVNGKRGLLTLSTCPHAHAQLYSLTRLGPGTELKNVRFPVFWPAVGPSGPGLGPICSDSPSSGPACSSSCTLPGPTAPLTVIMATLCFRFLGRWQMGGRQHE